MSRPAKETPPFRKRLATYGVIFIVTIALLESLSLALFERLTGKPFEYDALRDRHSARLAVLQQKSIGDKDSMLVYQFHPFVGYVGRPGAFPWEGQQASFNEYGMLSIANHRYPYKKRPNEFAIAVLGGSVADIFANLGQDFLNTALRKGRPPFNKTVVLINLATGGYKQPQQLFHLEYALLAGFEFDLVINLDGFNELALSAENMKHGINPIFPSGHHMGLMSRPAEAVPSARLVDQLSQYYRLQQTESWLLSLFGRRPLRYSVFGNLIAERWMGKNTRRMKELEYEIVTGTQSGLSPAFVGPKIDDSFGKDKYEVAATIWHRSSLMLQAVCQVHGLPYLHLLQPNQYVEGSKPLSEKEKAVALNSRNPWGAHAREGYKYLQSHGSRLVQEGVAFHDLSLIFKDHPEDLYIDDCCHFGPEGVAILAEYLAKVLPFHPAGRVSLSTDEQSNQG